MSTRYAPAARLERLRSLLSGGKCTAETLAAKLEVSDSTVRRMLRAVERAGHPLVEETLDDGRKTWSLPASPRAHRVPLTTAQLLALLIARNGAREILRGTGFDDDLDAACQALLDTLREKDAALAKDLDRKLYDRGEMPIDHAPRREAIDEIMTALLHHERLELRRRASDGEERTHLFDPYTIVIFKKGLYLVGFSHDRAQRISLGLDLVFEATRRRGDVFEYPADYHPAEMFKDSIGMFIGPMTRVTVRFSKEARRYIERRPIHHSQRVVREGEDGSIDVDLHIAGTTELESLVLSYGDKAEILTPPTLRKKMAEVLKRASKRYE